MAILLSDNFDNDGSSLRKINTNLAAVMAGTASLTVASSTASAPQMVSEATPIATTKNSVATLVGSFTRPSDTAPYAAGDVVANSTSAAALVEIASAALATGRGGAAQNFSLTKNGNVVTNARFRAHLFSTNVAGGVTIPGQDNAGFGVKYANNPYYLGSLDFPTMSIGTGTNTGARAILSSQCSLYSCVATSLYYLLEALDAYTPASAEIFTLTVTVSRD